MFPLSTTTAPADASQLSDSLSQGLATVLLPPTARQMVLLEAPNFPEADKLTVDITGCQLIEEAAQPPRGLHGSRPAFSVEQFRLTATPLLVRSAAIRMEVSASQVRFDYAQDTQGRYFLVPSVSQEGEGGEGQVRVELGRSDLQTLILAAVEPIAAANGIGVEDTQIELKSEGPRSVRLHVSATGRKLFVKAKVHVYGRLQIDTDLNATLDELRCEGDGFVGEMAEKMIQPKLNTFNGTRLPLAAFSLGGLKLHDLQIATPDGLEITAKLGGA